MSNATFGSTWASFLAPQFTSRLSSRSTNESVIPMAVKCCIRTHSYRNLGYILSVYLNEKSRYYLLLHSALRADIEGVRLDQFLDDPPPDAGGIVDRQREGRRIAVETLGNRLAGRRSVVVRDGPHA